MKMFNGNVSVYGVRPVKRAKRAVKRLLKAWCPSLGLPESMAAESQYDAVVEQLGESRTFWCSIRMRIRSQHWTGGGAGKDLREAVGQALQQIYGRVVASRTPAQGLMLEGRRSGVRFIPWMP